MVANSAKYFVKPDHVPSHLVVDFDLFNIPGANEDVHLAFRVFQQSGPEIFWSPYNGGHWVVTRADDIEEMQRDYTRFSNRSISIPHLEGLPAQIPLELDPPKHAPYRRPLTQALLPRAIDTQEGKIRTVINELIDDFIEDGGCNFVAQFGQILPIVVFLDLANCDREDRHVLLPLTEDIVRGETAEKRLLAYKGLTAYLNKHVIDRREKPGLDLLSVVVNTTVEGQRISVDEAIMYATTVFIAGLDTVAALLAFIARFLAENPLHRRQIIEKLDDSAFKRNVCEELIRRHGLANIGRVVTCNFEYKGVPLREGDMVLLPNLLAGLDERRVENPTEVDFQRPFPIYHAAFGNGAHICPGSVLARREVKLFLEEWLKRIPEFSLAPGAETPVATGGVNAILKLDLCWPIRPPDGEFKSI